MITPLINHVLCIYLAWYGLCFHGILFIVKNPVLYVYSNLVYK